jgi:hypothetical protein
VIAAARQAELLKKLEAHWGLEGRKSPLGEILKKL